MCVCMLERGDSVMIAEVKNGLVVWTISFLHDARCMGLYVLDCQIVHRFEHATHSEIRDKIDG